MAVGGDHGVGQFFRNLTTMAVGGDHGYVESFREHPRLEEQVEERPRGRTPSPSLPTHPAVVPQFGAPVGCWQLVWCLMPPVSIGHGEAGAKRSMESAAGTTSHGGVAAG